MPALHTETPHLVETDTGPAPRDYGTGRRCAHPGCATRLHRYHRGQFCHLHENDRPQEAAMSTRGIRKEQKAAIAERKARVLRLLMEANGEPVRKPADMPQEHWSYAIDRLRLEGYVIIPVPNKGMSLVESPQSAAEPQTPTEPPEAPQAPETGSGEATEAQSKTNNEGWPTDGSWQSPNEAVEHADPQSTNNEGWPKTPRPPDFAGVDVIREPGTPTRQGDVIVQTFVPFAGQEPLEAKYADPELEALALMLDLSDAAQDRIADFLISRRRERDGVKVGLTEGR